jgi:3-oxoadipate enol-lactonase
MPFVDADGCPLHVEIAGPGDAPVLMLSNSLGTDLRMWDTQMPALTQRFRVVRYDRRGHGRSGVPPGPYDMQRLGRDALAIMDALSLETVHWCGLSMGGMVGQWLGAHAPQRIGKLILSNTSSYYADKAPWDERIRIVTEKGIAAVAERLMTVWFSTGFRERDKATVERMKAMLAATPVTGYVGCCAAIRDMDHRALLPAIKAPTLVIAGRHDPATPVEAAEFIRSRIAGATLTVLETGHVANIEQPQRYTDTLLAFLTKA